jgi:acyl carrier protein
MSIVWNGMSADDLTYALCDYIATDLLEGEVAVLPTSHFSDIGFDSLFMMELIVAFERLSGQRVSASLLSSPELTCVEKLVALVVADRQRSSAAVAATEGLSLSARGV